MTSYFRDPTLVELLSDPLTHAVMQADHVNPQNLRTYCAIWRVDALIPWPTLRPASGSASIDHLRRYNELLFEPAKRRGKEVS